MVGAYTFAEAPAIGTRAEPGTAGRVYDGARYWARLSLSQVRGPLSAASERPLADVAARSPLKDSPRAPPASRRLANTRDIQRLAVATGSQ
jgi:hypothetical protein